MKIALIDNGSSLLQKMEALLENEQIIKHENIEAVKEGDFDLIVLSGSKKSSVRYSHADFVDEIELIKTTTKPLIGICFGCELIAHAFGGKLKELQIIHQGIKDIEILDPILSDAKEIKVYEHHRWIIETVPKEFRVIAESKDGPEAIKHTKLPIFGLQFHPENTVDQNQGSEVFKNIVSTF